MKKIKKFLQPQGRPELGKDAFQGLLGEMALFANTRSEADPAATLATLVSYTSCMAGREGAVTPGGTIREPLGEWVVIVGDSSYGRKGTAKEDILAFFRNIEDAYMPPRIVKSLVSERGLANEVRDDSGKVNEDGDPIHDGREDKRLWVCVSEFGKVMGNMKNPALSLSDGLCSIWEGDDIHISTGKSVKATKPGVVVYGNITGEIFAERFDANMLAGGILNRILPIFSHRSKFFSATNVPKEFEQKRYAYGNLLAARIREFIDGVPEGDTQIIPLDGASQQWWDDELHEELTTKPVGLSAFANLFVARRASHVLRIAAVFALVDSCVKIGIQHLKAALALVKYSLDTVVYMEKEFHIEAIRESKSDGALRKLHDILTTAGVKGVSRTDIVMKHFGSKLKAADLDHMLQQLPVEEFKEHLNGADKPARFYRLKPERLAKKIPQQLDLSTLDQMVH